MGDPSPDGPEASSHAQSTLSQGLQLWLLLTALAYFLWADSEPPLRRLHLRTHVLYDAACCASFALVRASPWPWQGPPPDARWARALAACALPGIFALDAFAALRAWETLPSALASFACAAPLVGALAFIAHAHVRNADADDAHVCDAPELKAELLVEKC